MPSDTAARIRDLLGEHPVVDGHNDLAWAARERVGYDWDRLDISRAGCPTHTDLPRLRAGGVGAQFWSVFVPATLQGDAAVTATLEQVDAVHAMTARYAGDLALATTRADVERAWSQGRIASLLGAEGGHSIDSSLGALRMLHALGVRYLTLTHNDNVPWADSATDEPVLGGLSPFGREVVREMNRLGMLVDLSHVSADTMHDALDVAEAPVLFSHSSARAVCDHPRNVPDDVLASMRTNGGVVMVNFYSAFTDPQAARVMHDMVGVERGFKAQHPGDPAAVDSLMDAWRAAHPIPRGNVATVADHVDHLVKVAGIDHVGIGSDFDGISTTPVGLEDVSMFPNLTAELLRRGYSDGDVQKILGLNLLRAMQQAEQVSARLKRERPASTRTIEEMDGRARP